MNALKVLQKQSRVNFCQYFLFDKNGILFESCNSIFDSSGLLSKPFQNWFPFIESIYPELEKLDASDELKFSKLHQPSSFLNGIYDFTFSKIELDQKTYLSWIVYDKTSIYLTLLGYQQQKNEFEIQRQAHEAKTQSLTKVKDYRNTKFDFDPIDNEESSLKVISILEVLRKQNIDFSNKLQKGGEDLFGIIDEKINSLEKLKKEMEVLRQIQHVLPSDLLNLSMMVLEHINKVPEMPSVTFKPNELLPSLKTKYAINIGQVIYIMLSMIKLDHGYMPVLYLDSKLDKFNYRISYKLVIDLGQCTFKDENLVMEEKIGLMHLLSRDMRAKIYGNFELTPHQFALIFTFPVKND